MHLEGMRQRGGRARAGRGAHTQGPARLQP